jgi:hypothetical protein
MSFYSDFKAWADKRSTLKLYPVVAPENAGEFFGVYSHIDTTYTYTNFGTASVTKQYTLAIASLRYDVAHETAEKYYNEFKKHPNYRFENYSERYEDGYYIKDFVINYKE